MQGRMRFVGQSDLEQTFKDNIDTIADSQVTLRLGLLSGQGSCCTA